jgi:4-azaleucine resistance transporter AzlC
MPGTFFTAWGMLERYRGVGRLRPFLVCVLCDETFSIVSAVPPPAGVEPRQFYFWVSFLDYAYWVCATAAGGILGGVLTFNTAGMDFALTALFAVLFLEQWKDPKNRPAGLMGLGGAAAALALFGAKSMVLPAMALVLALLLGERRRLCA